ncbi:MAG: hypothetical protein LRZ88_07885 [Candidatus Cloacimonetes bacterium]|nr:hypothetical protein [Candidatus Cloacimonadota bacterium]
MKAVKISIIINKDLSKSVTDDLFALGLRQIFSEVGRSSILNKSSSFPSFLSRGSLLSYPVEIISFIVQEADELSVLSYIAKKYVSVLPAKAQSSATNLIS